MRLLSSLTRVLGRSLAVVLCVLLTLLVLLATVETVAWAVFDLSWAALIEIQELLMAWLVLLSGAYAVREGLHLAVEWLVKRFPAAVQRWLALLPPALVGLFGVLLAIFGARLITAVHNTLPATGLPAAVGYTPTVVAGALIALFAAERFLIAGRGALEPEGETDGG